MLFRSLIAAVCPGMVDTATSRPWFSDYSHAQSPYDAARPVLDLILTEPVEPYLYGELVRFGQALDWHGGTPPVEQDRISEERRVRKGWDRSCRNWRGSH